jgi:hypothetical protein
MNKAQYAKYNSEEAKWNFIFKMRRKNRINKANYTFHYFVNQDCTEILEVSYNKELIITCPLKIDEIITCYFTCDDINITNLLKLVDVIKNAFRLSCVECDAWEDNKCEHWEDYINGETLVKPDGDEITRKKIDTFYKLYEINNDHKETPKNMIEQAIQLLGILSKKLDN